MYRIALTHHDTTRHHLTPRHRDTAPSIEEAIEQVRAHLPGVDLPGLTEERVNTSINQANDFRCDVAATPTDGGEWRVVIAPMM